VAPKRPYRSPLRSEQAAATRERILRAAASLLLSRGYAATKLELVATEAGVALPTLTGYFPTKAVLLDEVLRSVARGGAGGERPTLGQQLSALLDITNPTELLTALAALIRAANERGFELFEILRTAASAEPKLEERRREGAEARRRDQARIAHHLRHRGALREDLSEQEATDLLWLYSSADVYRLLVHDSRWSPERYERWLARTLADTLLKP
jgi:AcrR family transcriptional regulator